MDQPGKVANPVRDQLNRENYFFPYPRSRLRIWSRVTGSAVPSRAVFHLKVDEEQMEDHTRKYEASGWNWVPRSTLLRATTHRCSSYVDLTRELWSRVNQKDKGKRICLSK